MRCKWCSIRETGAFFALVLAAGFSSMVAAQEAAFLPAAKSEMSGVPATDLPAAGAAADLSRLIEIPRLTEVEFEILEPLGSKVSRSLDTFAIRLAAPIMIGGVEAVPAGTMGVGEVVHAKKAGGMGAAGELVLAARYLDLGDRRIRLRSMQLKTTEATSRIGTANAIGTAGAATVLPVALIGFFVKGGEVDVPEGTFASARIAENFTVTIAANADMSDELAEAETAPEEEIPAETPAVINGEVEL